MITEGYCYLKIRNQEDKTMIRSLQTKIWYADDIIPYADLIKSVYPVQVIQYEALVGFKISLIDNVRMSPAERIPRLEQLLPSILGGTRCMLRETPITAPFGYYLVTMPVPRDQLRSLCSEILRVLTILERDFGITVTKEYEINVSGACTPMETEIKLSRFDIPVEYQKDVFGQFDSNIKKIEKALHITIVSRENELKIIGGEIPCRRGKKIIETLISSAKAGENIDEQKVNYAIALSMEDRVESMSDLDGDIICRTIMGKPVKPKTFGT